MPGAPDSIAGLEATTRTSVVNGVSGGAYLPAT
jgi:hypothetical protein